MTPDSDIIEDYEQHLTGAVSPKTARIYARTAWAAHRELPRGLPTASTAELTAWLERYESPRTRRTYISALRHFATWAVAADHINRSDAAALVRPPEPDALPNPCQDEELATILAGAREPYRTWSLLAAYAGCRCVEISRLLREHVNVDRVRLLGKRNKLRRVPTHELVWVAVRELPPGLLADGHDPDYISGRLRREYLSLGVDVTAHQLRHWYGTTLVKAGAGIEEVKQLMGHSRLATTLGYVAVASPRLTAAVARLPALS